MSARLVRHTLIYAVGSVGLRAASFLLVPLYTRTLPMEEYGLLETLLLGIQVLVLVMNAGTRVTLLRYVHQAVQGGEADKLIGSVLAANLAGFAGAALLVMAGAPALTGFLHLEGRTWLLWLLLTGALAQSLCHTCMSYYRGVSRPLGFLAAGGGVAVLLLIANAVLLGVLNLGLAGALAGFVLANGVVALGLLAALARGVGFRPTAAGIGRALRFGLPLALSGVGQFVLGAAGAFFLMRGPGLRETAIYTLGLKLSHVLEVMVLMPFQLAFLPHVFASAPAAGEPGRPGFESDMARAFQGLVLTVMAVGLALAVGFRLAFPLLAPPEYAPSFEVVLLLVPASVCKGVQYFAESLLLLAERTRAVGVAVGVSAAACIGLNALLVPMWGWRGALAATLCSYALSAGLTLSAGLRCRRIDLGLGRVATRAAGFLGLLGLMQAAHDSGDKVFYGLSAVLVAVAVLAGLRLAPGLRAVLVDANAPRQGAGR